MATIHTDTKYKALKSIILSQLLIEANDDIKGSNLYKANLKKFGKAYMTQLGIAIKQIDKINEANPAKANEVYNAIDGIAEKLAQLDIEKLLEVSVVIDEYLNQTQQ